LFVREGVLIGSLREKALDGVESTRDRRQRLVVDL
jgi:hypothetical protein